MNLTLDTIDLNSEASIPRAYARYSDPLGVVATVIDSGNKPLAGIDVTFTLDTSGRAHSDGDAEVVDFDTGSPQPLGDGTNGALGYSLGSGG